MSDEPQDDDRYVRHRPDDPTARGIWLAHFPEDVDPLLAYTAAEREAWVRDFGPENARDILRMLFKLARVMVDAVEGRASPEETNARFDSINAEAQETLRQKKQRYKDRQT